MKVSVKLTLAAEDFSECYGILIIKDGDLFVQIDHLEIPLEFIGKLKKWHKDYYKFTGMSIEELKLYTHEIEGLDSIGIELLKAIYRLKIFKNINKYVYYNRRKDEVLFELL